MPTKGDHHRLSDNDVAVLLAHVLEEHHVRVRLSLVCTAYSGASVRTAVSASLFKATGQRIRDIPEAVAYWPNKTRQSRQAVETTLIYQLIEALSEWELELERASEEQRRTGSAPTLFDALEQFVSQ